jgi:lipopolysaccharide transport system ATP-binding protein
MTETVLKLENVSKQYRLGQIGTGTLSHDLNRWWASVRGKDDPYAKVGVENDRSKATNDNYVWALKDVNLDVKQGEILGVIGKNGAGKSTLLKLLSQVTQPSTGSIKVRGRIASLLEVGTGFHPELTGKENIFLNGAILGMTKREIHSKLEEIVDFAGVAKYLDTPTKRYSSGMTVRLGFAIAAHLEPEILVVDEVLAVGDAEFQRKAIGKMQDVSRQGGRTVLFVSHNMSSIRTLCEKVVMLNNGTVHKIGEPAEVISEYLSVNRGESQNVTLEIPNDLSTYGNGEAKFKSVLLINSINSPTRKLFFCENFTLRIKLNVFRYLENVIVNIFILNAYGEKIVTYSSGKNFQSMAIEEGSKLIEVGCNESLIPGEYSLCLLIAYHNTGNSIDYVESVYSFEVLKDSRNGTFDYPWVTRNGIVYSDQIIKISQVWN